MSKIYNIVCDGNSLTAGTGASNAANTSWPPVCMSNLSASQASHTNKYFSFKSVAVAGNTTVQRTAAFATNVHIQYNVAYPRNIVTFFEVSNDVITNAATLNTAILNVQTYVKQARLMGWDVMLSTVPPTSQTTNGVNTIIPQFNSWLLANSEWSDFPIVDLAGHVNLSNPANTTYFNADGLHLTDAGYATVASLFQAGLEASVDPGPTTLALLKRIVNDFDQLEKSDAVTWSTCISAISTESYRRMFQIGNSDRIRFRYMVYGWEDSLIDKVYNELVAAFSL